MGDNERGPKTFSGYDESKFEDWEFYAQKYVMRMKKRYTLDAESEIAEIVWRDCTMNVLLSIKGCYVQSGQWGPLAHVEAIMLRQEAACPFEDEPECDL